ncbi:unnamed protein product [Protopolystoma xenopodis]|uniref:Uncharacterized protein n=1 Tax=Protopolystoma xenopodis TaxID=117903 RepID=A0A448XLW2_9PLAT|nr:unnamed protein product [Protopolystoma xenopodis]
MLDSLVGTRACAGGPECTVGASTSVLGQPGPCRQQFTGSSCRIVTTRTVVMGARIRLVNPRDRTASGPVVCRLAERSRPLEAGFCEPTGSSEDGSASLPSMPFHTGLEHRDRVCVAPVSPPAKPMEDWLCGGSLSSGMP